MNDISSMASDIKARTSFDLNSVKEKISINRMKNQKFNDTLKSAIIEEENSKKKPVDTKLMDVCTEMESLFVAKMLKEMRKTVHKNEMLHGGFAEEIFEDMLYDKYALDISKKANLGLAHQLYNEMSKI